MQNPELESDSRVDDGDLIHIGDIEFKIIATPGHTKGGLSLYCEKERWYNVYECCRRDEGC